jgi:hypothetical protein
MLDGSPELSGLLMALFRAHGRRPMRVLDMLDVIRKSLTSLGQVSNRSDRELAALLRRGYVVYDRTSHRYRLAARAADYAEQQLFFSRAEERVDTIAEQKMDAVTRRFVEEVLQEASLPAELMDAIVATYQMTGRIEMSEDGNRYVIRLGQG